MLGKRSLLGTLEAASRRRARLAVLPLAGAALFLTVVWATRNPYDYCVFGAGARGPRESHPFWVR